MLPVRAHVGRNCSLASQASVQFQKQRCGWRFAKRGTKGRPSLKDVGTGISACGLGGLRARGTGRQRNRETRSRSVRPSQRSRALVRRSHLVSRQQDTLGVRGAGENRRRAADPEFDYLWASGLSTPPVNTMTFTLPREHQPGAICLTAMRILALWNAPDAESEVLLGLLPGELAKWQATPPPLASLPRETIFRISYLLGIYAALQILFPDPLAANSWVMRHNTSPVFGGHRPIDRMLSGRIEDLKAVRRFVDGWCQ